MKTEAGVRFVPIHPELRRIGLLDYVEKRRKNDMPTASSLLAISGIEHLKATIR